MDRINETIVAGLLLMQCIVTRVRKSAAHAESGQGMVEYALILSFIAFVAVVALKVVGPAIAATFTNVANTLNGSGAATPTPAP